MEFNDIISYQNVSTIGWTLIHSLWQGLLISLLITLVLTFVDKKNAKLRSIISYCSLILIFMLSIGTYVQINNQKTEVSFVEVSSTNIAVSKESSNNENLEISSSAPLKFNSIYNKYGGLIKKFLSDNIKMVVFLWFVGVLFLSFRLIGGVFFTQRLKSKEIYPVGELWDSRIVQLQEKLKILKKVTLVQSKLIKIPVTIGYFKPVILLPLGLISGIPQNQLEIIIAHELAHIKRADYILNILQSIIEVFFFFNPAVWFISKTIRREREYLCDDIAIDACGNSITLAKALLFVKNNEQFKATNSTIAMAVIGNKNSLMGRIKRMTHYKTEKKQFGIALIIIPILLLVTFLTSSTSANLSENENFAVLEATQQPINFIENEFSSNDIETSSIPEMASVPSKFQLKDDDDRNQFSFHEKGVHWKAIFEKGKLVELYKDGESIPKEQFPQYEDIINKRYAEFEEDMEDLSINMEALHLDMDQLKEDLKDIRFEFDQEEFMEEMKQVKHDLKLELKELENLDINIDFDVDELNESLKNIKVDLSGLDEGMANLKVELAGMKKELKILKYFMLDLKDGLVADGYLEEDDDDFDLELSETEMILNGKQLPDSTLQKYLKLYKEHFGKDLEDEFRINN